MKRYCAIILSQLSFFISIAAADAVYSYFDTKFLAQPHMVRQQLIEKDGFKEGFLPSSDDIPLHYLWLARPNARYSVICCSGFWPGVKEGLATFYELFPDDCNILFFDARGHGMSEGPFLKSLLNYGVHEYKDIEGAVQWVYAQSKRPIIVFGVCAGAFHATQAALSMQRKQLIEQYAVCGIIFDSGWSSLRAIIPTAFSGEWKKRMMKKIKAWPKSLQTGIISPISMLIQLTTPILARVCLSKKACQKNLLSKVQELNTPVLFIHAEDDMFAVIKPVKLLARKTKQAYVWWITEPSTHACHHMKHANKYKNQLKAFIDRVVPA